MVAANGRNYMQGWNSELPTVKSIPDNLREPTNANHGIQA